MSVEHGRSDATRTRWLAGIDLDGTVGPGSFRLLAVGCVALLTASYLRVLQDVTSVVGGTQSLLLVVGAVLVAATCLAYTVRPRTATVAAVVVIVLGVDTYLQAAGVDFGTAVSTSDSILSDSLAFATGLPIVRMVEAGTWTLAFAPGPVFLSWYFALRGRYVASVIPGGFALFFLVLTGDAGTTITLLGTMGALGAIGFGELERRGGSIAHADVLAITFAVMLVLSLSFASIGGGTLFGEAEPNTLDTTLDASPDRSTVGGTVELSPEVRFTVDSPTASYWRTGVYDRFTGDGWVRTGETTPYDGRIEPPPGDTDELSHTVTMVNEQRIMPAAPQPVTLTGDGVDAAEVSNHGQVHPGDTLLEGDSYTVESAVIDPDPDELRAAGTDYPSDVEETYLQIPESTSSEFETYTEAVVADADTPYEKAVAIETFLRESKSYSLDVEPPSGNVAEEFLFEMDEGYCVYFATTMTQMLRAEDVPARYVTGYTEGQQIGDDEWVVRGLDAHAWVEVYVPNHGWVAFEPTPPARDDVHAGALEEAREAGLDGVDTDRSENVPIDGQTDETDPDENETDPDENETDPGDQNGTETDPDDSSPSDSVPDVSDIEPPDRDDGGGILPGIAPENVAIGLVALAGVVASAHRSGIVRRASREARLYWHGSRGAPERDVRRAYRRLEILLRRRYRPRRPAETVREYLDELSTEHDLDPRITAVARRYERATYGGSVDGEAADDAVATVDALAREHTPILGRRRS